MYNSSFPGTGDPNVLNQVYVPIISNAQCNHEDWYDGRITSTMVCAGLAQGGLDSCQVSTYLTIFQNSFLEC